MAPQPVVVFPYDPEWPETFVSIRRALTEALRKTAIAIEHVGSTSVPGMAAKPIIDIDIVIGSEAELTCAISKLAAIGYRYEGEKGVVGRHAFRPPTDLPKHHPYVCAVGNPELNRHLAFRDHLRENESDAKAYAKLKRELAERFGTDRDGYSEAKTAFVEEVLRKVAAKLKRSQR
jgi:GrpB-like predicted nucleotidyltransferase (UPF0157 family)